MTSKSTTGYFFIFLFLLFFKKKKKSTFKNPFSLLRVPHLVPTWARYEEQLKTQHFLRLSNMASCQAVQKHDQEVVHVLQL